MLQLWTLAPIARRLQEEHPVRGEKVSTAPRGIERVLQMLDHVEGGDAFEAGVQRQLLEPPWEHGHAERPLGEVNNPRAQLRAHCLESQLLQESDKATVTTADLQSAPGGCVTSINRSSQNTHRSDRSERARSVMAGNPRTSAYSVQ